MIFLTRNEVVEKIREELSTKYGTQKEAAKAFGVSDSMISSVLTGKKIPTQDLLKLIGCKKVTYFVKDKP